MGNLAKDFEAVAQGLIIGAVIGGNYRKPWTGKSSHPLCGKLVSWAEARPILDYEYDDGYGAADCHAAYAWTETQVIFVYEYDGSTAVQFVPRNPVPCEPEFGGS